MNPLALNLRQRPLKLAASILSASLFLSCLSPQAKAQAVSTPPERLAYQGYLVDANGNPLGSTNAGPKNYDVIFRIWNDQAATTVVNRLWAEQQTITVDKGYFSALLGEGTSYASEPHPGLSVLFAAPDASERYVEVTVKAIGANGQDVTISPRLRLLSSPYSFLARQANSAGALVNSTNGQVVSVSGNNVAINGNLTAATITGNGSGLTALPSNAALLDADETFSGNVQFANGLGLQGTLQAGDSIRLAPKDLPILTRDYTPFSTGPKQGVGRWGLFMEPARLYLGVAGSDYGPAAAIGFGGWRADSTREDWMTLTGGGNVGIGTTIPGARLDVRGDVSVQGNIKLGSAAQYYAPGATEKLRIVRGIINPKGTVFPNGQTNGVGFVAQELSQGVYRITFTPAFADVPVVTASPIMDPNGSYRGDTAQWQNLDKTGVGIVVIAGVGDTVNSPGLAVERSFSFIAIGAP